MKESFRIVTLDFSNLPDINSRLNIPVEGYSQEDIFHKFRNKKCLECEDVELESKGSSPNGGWVYYYECNSCAVKYEFQESDMGQSQPYLISDAKNS